MTTAYQHPQRLPPHNPDAERCVLGSMLRDNAVIGEVLQILHAESFYGDAHQKIFVAIRALYDKGQPADLVTLAEPLREQKQIEDIGGYPYLAGLWDAAPTAANAEYYARIVRDKAIIRNLIHASNEVLRDAYDQAQPADELLEGAERKIMEIAQFGRASSITPIGESARAVLAEYDDRSSRGQPGPAGLATGFPQLDDVLGGLDPGELIIAGACTGVAKSQFALSVALHAALQERAGVFYVSMEMKHPECTKRLLCVEGNLDPRRLRRGELNGAEVRALIAAAGRFEGAPIFYDDSPDQTLQRLARGARLLKLRRNIGLVVADYLQLAKSEPSSRHATRQEAVAAIARGLKNLAMELNVPVIAVSQLSRGAEHGEQPKLGHLRESGEIEHAADVVLFLWQPVRDSNIVRLYVAKQRNGPKEIVIDFTLDWPPGRLQECPIL